MSYIPAVLFSFNAKDKVTTTAVATTLVTLLSVCDSDPRAVNVHDLTAHNELSTFALLFR